MSIISMSFILAFSILLLALVIDWVLGDPSPNEPWKIRYKLHPTVWIGWFTGFLARRLKNPNPKIEKLGGVILALIVTASSTLLTYAALRLVNVYLGIIAYLVLASFLLKSTVCIKLESDWGVAASKAIKAGDLTEARKYAHFSRRDPTNLTGSQIASSVIESIAENLTDFKISPLFYYFLFGVPGAIAFRAINVLDGMVGFKDPEHINIGWFSAKLDTIANYITTRIAALLIVIAAAILGEDHREAWRIAKRDQAKVPSVNHGWTMAAMAGALGVQLEKPGHYVIGDKKQETSSIHVLKTLKIRNMVMFLFIILIGLPMLFLRIEILRILI
ncbi:MAG: cobalamin biosynthesis protein [Candidatus Bathyarchaeota archaeon]|nr:cobalamin biosynthesis protein [Candidatus Bathyarchaeota archaeon]MCX8177509.1 cobalamin biosynthesis protein [Candidatus Bathyarchaeota archaeon]MDW8194176.1 cobalamin biosynthesis protein [Nitrososphaerota archaeon]